MAITKEKMTKIVLNCVDYVGTSMAGPAIRYWEIAHALKRYGCEVSLLVPNNTDLKSDEITIISRAGRFTTEQFQGADAIITQQVTATLHLAARQSGARILLDAYDPMPLENLEIFKNNPFALRNHRQKQILTSFRFSFDMADGILCANNEQRHLWLGFLLQQGRLSPAVYDSDPHMQRMVGVVPFGLSSKPLQGEKGLLRKRFGLKDTDKILLWGGGIWNWFDPLTLIKAVYLLSQRRPDIFLVFMGIKHPNPFIPEMKMASQAIDLARELQLLDKHVFFNYGWLPYQERQAYLLDADIGVSTHCSHLETEFAFRTRILDYIWAGLPIIATEGDSFAKLIERHELGRVVPYGDVDALAQVIEEISDNPRLAASMRSRLSVIRPQFHWENVINPICEIVQEWKRHPKRYLKATDISLLLRFIWAKRGPTALWKAYKARYGT